MERSIPSGSGCSQRCSPFPEDKSVAGALERWLERWECQSQQQCGFIPASQRHHDPQRGPPELLPAPAALPPPLPAGPGGQGQPRSLRSLLPAGSAPALRREPDLEPEAAQGPAEPPGCGSGTRQRLPNASAAPEPLPGKEGTPKTSLRIPEISLRTPEISLRSCGNLKARPCPFPSPVLQLRGAFRHPQPERGLPCGAQRVQGVLPHHPAAAGVGGVRLRKPGERGE